MTTTTIEKTVEGHVYISRYDYDNKFGVRTYIDKRHFEGLVDVAIAIALSWPEIPDDLECKRIFLPSNDDQWFWLHAYSDDRSKKSGQNLAVCLSFCATGMSSSLYLNWDEFQNVIQRITWETS